MGYFARVCGNGKHAETLLSFQSKMSGRGQKRLDSLCSPELLRASCDPPALHQLDLTQLGPSISRRVSSSPERWGMTLTMSNNGDRPGYGRRSRSAMLLALLACKVIRGNGKYLEATTECVRYLNAVKSTRTQHGRVVALSRTTCL